MLISSPTFIQPMVSVI